MKSVFGDLLITAAKLEDIDVDIFSDGWVHRLSKNGFQHYTYGYQFDLNSGVSQQLATDKCAAYELLNHAGLNAVTHRLTTTWVYKNRRWIRLDSQEMISYHIQNILVNNQLPLVLKPINGTGGHDVVLVKKKSELSKLLTKLFEKYGMVAVAPFIKAESETRLYMLDGKCLLAYQKTAPAGEWRFNLSGGAKAKVLKPEKSIEIMARQALEVIGLRLGAVDFLNTAKGPVILEVNSGIMLNNFASHGQIEKDLAVNIYRQILQTTFI